MTKDNQPDNRRARKKKNIDKLPLDTRAQKDSTNTKKQIEVMNDD